MSEDKDIGSSDTPTGEEILDNPKKETVRQLFRLGTQILGIADKIDWKNPTILRKASSDQLGCVKLDSGLIYIDFAPILRGHRVNLTLYNQEIDQIDLLNRDHFGNFQEFFEETSIYEVSLTSHEDHDSDKSLHTYAYALSADGEAVRASWEDTFIRDKAEYTKEIDPGEIEMVGAAMNILRGRLEKFSPTAAV